MERSGSDDNGLDLAEDEIEDLSAEDVIEFMRIIETSKRYVFEAEREREQLEIKYLVGLLISIIVDDVLNCY